MPDRKVEFRRRLRSLRHDSKAHPALAREVKDRYPTRSSSANKRLEQTNRKTTIT